MLQFYPLRHGGERYTLHAAFTGVPALTISGLKQCATFVCIRHKLSEVILLYV